jgi:glutamate-1-semialdehyde aminotransferase
MSRSEGCRLWDEFGKEYTDMIMALGAVGLGYAYPSVVTGAQRAIRDGVVGSLAPTLEAEVAEQLATVIPCAESVRFFKTGAEAVAAAVRIARVHTGRENVITCGYHGWLDWCQSGAGVPQDVVALRRAIPFNDMTALESAMAEHGPVAAVVIEPVIDGPPDEAWLGAVRDQSSRAGAVLVFDEVKTAFRIALGGAAERYHVTPDLAAVGKALGNGFPIAAVCGPAGLMNAATETLISSTLATESVSLAAARAVIQTYQETDVVAHLDTVGRRFYEGLERLARSHPSHIAAVRGLPQMCHLQFASEEDSGCVALLAAVKGVLFKRDAYNFVSLAHTEEVVDRVLGCLEECLVEVFEQC